ncbi:MAG TPA: FAD-dependent oxidoreductase [Acidimicrobiales bacterium]|nr:FAD-dependent oxidoreductase [Acidimicrobiales bacterium]
MSDIVICGGGVGGLLTAMILAADGHEVTVLERDAALPPEAAEAWTGWERRGVNQFRLPHFLLAAFRETIEAELPGVLQGLEAAGAYRMNPIFKFSGGRMNLPEFDLVTARRPVLEAVVSAAADRTEGVTIRRGCGISGLVSAAERDGTPHVKGVVTEAGEKIGADLVVDSTGRRSPLGRWLGDIGAAPIEEQREDSGFVYYGRHVRTTDGSPFPSGPGMAYFGSVALLVLPADQGTAGVGIITCTGDAPLRVLRHEAAWRAAMQLLPGGEEILDAEPISDLMSMSGLEDRWIRPVAGGRTVATGVLPVGDAWASTNPTLGRGISLGVRHAVALRDTLREHGDQPRQLAESFDAVTQDVFTPWYLSTVWHDRHRVETLRAAAEDRRPACDDPLWDEWIKLQALPSVDPSVVPTLFEGGLLLRQTPELVLQDPAIQEALSRNEIEPDPPAGPSRDELLAAVTRAA